MPTENKFTEKLRQRAAYQRSANVLTISQLIQQLVTDGGAIVSSNDCSDGEIECAIAAGRCAVESCHFYVRRTKEWLALSSNHHMNHWIPITKKLPEKGQTVIVTNLEVRTAARFECADEAGAIWAPPAGVGGYEAEFEPRNITHWMGMPDFPTP